MADPRLKILVVENPDLPFGVVEGLWGRDYGLLRAASAQEALALAREGAPSLILLTLGTPGVDVYALCGELAEGDTADIPVLLAGTGGAEADHTLAFEKGALDVLPGSFSAALTAARIRNALELKQYRDFLRSMALMDPTTGLANRRRFDEFLDLEWRRNLRNDSDLSLIQLDLDRFKPFVKQYGTATANQALKQVAQALAEATQRPGDLLARIGEGTFACILPETDRIGAVSVAERMRAHVMDLAIPHEFSDVAPVLTASLGTASVLPTADGSFTLLFDATGQRVKDAKARGRNRIEFG